MSITVVLCTGLSAYTEHIQQNVMRPMNDCGLNEQRAISFLFSPLHQMTQCLQQFYLLGQRCLVTVGVTNKLDRFVTPKLKLKRRTYTEYGSGESKIIDREVCSVLGLPVAGQTEYCAQPLSLYIDRDVVVPSQFVDRFPRKYTNISYFIVVWILFFFVFIHASY